MDLIVISDPVCFENESNLINQLFAAGMPVFHLRKPQLGKMAYTRLIAEIDEIYHDRIALHQFHELITFFPSIERLHYPEWLRKSTTVTTLQIENQIIRSTSVHDLKDLDQLNEFDYAFYGPVFNSLSKPGYAGVIDTDFVLPQRKNSCKIIALGGVDAGKIAKLKRMGFDGMAVLGAIWNQKERTIDHFNILINRK